MEQALAGGLRATGVFAHNDPMADCFDPPLTTIRLDGDEVGRRAGTAVLAAIRDLPAVPTGPPVPAELVVRAQRDPLWTAPSTPLPAG
jgi:DNA-binding LacI/PurR family transcriptional regulator